MAEHSEFVDLSRRIRESGLLKRQPAYMVMKIVTTSAMLAASIAILFLVHNIWLQLLNAAFLAFVFTHIAYLGHDIGHRQSFSGQRTNEVAGLIFGNVALGVSAGHWVTKHNKHHANPNHADMDPDIDIPIIAFSREQAQAKKGFQRFMVKYQAFFFFPVLLLEAFSLYMGTAKYLVKSPRRWMLESSLVVLHFVAYGAIIFSALPLWQAILFITVNQALFGLYLASVFAPNHKGMLVIKDRMDFLHEQVLTARNVRSNAFTDFWYGGLNFQIEHHLFPTMPRNNLSKAQAIIREFCAEKGISYHETGMWRSYGEILSYLHQVSSVLRRPVSD